MDMKRTKLTLVGKHCPIFGPKYGVRAYYTWQIWETKVQVQMIEDWLNGLTAGYEILLHTTNSLIELVGIIIYLNDGVLTLMQMLN